MSAPVAVAHLLELSKRYKSLRFHAVDNIIDPNYLKTVLPDLAEIGVDLDLQIRASQLQHLGEHQRCDRLAEGRRETDDFRFLPENVADRAIQEFWNMRAKSQACGNQVLRMARSLQLIEIGEVFACGVVKPQN